jgi:hypothetical protein
MAPGKNSYRVMPALMDTRERRLSQTDLAYKRLARLIILGSAAFTGYVIFELIWWVT